MNNIQLILTMVISKVDQGACQKAVIVWDKTPYMSHARKLPPEEAYLKKYQVEEVVTQYKYFIKIDLYVLEFSFNWLWPRFKND